MPAENWRIAGADKSSGQVTVLIAGLRLCLLLTFTCAGHEGIMIVVLLRLAYLAAIGPRPRILDTDYTAVVTVVDVVVVAVS